MAKRQAPEGERTLPSNLEAERAVLGAVLVRNELYDAAADVLEPGDFYREAHSQIFAAMGRLANRHLPVDLLTLREELGRSGDLEAVGGPAYVSALADGIPRTLNVEHYAGIVLEKSRLRAAIATGTRLVNSAYLAEGRSAELAADAAERLYALGSDVETGKALTLADLIAPGMQALERAAAGNGVVTGTPTGFLALDDLTAGLQRGDLILIAARTSQGKTALAMNLVRQIGAGAWVLVFSLEMSRLQLFLRMLASEALVDSHRLRTGHLGEADWGRISTALGTLNDLKVLIDDSGGLGVREVRARARQVKAKHGLGAIVIDYIQLMHGRGNFDNRTQEIGTLSRGLKAVARELDVPVVALSQLSRAAEPMPGRKARRPQLSDLAESGSLENDADVVFLIYRPEPKEDGSDESVAEIIVAKQRNGPTGVVKLHWNAQHVRFENIGAF
jgi:replicative DNA helicase